LRAARANRVFCTDEKHIRTENTVIVNIKDSAGVFHKIAARTVFRPRQFATPQQQERDCKGVELFVLD
jgi:hypothetical protein